jgi:branched-chain amino acid transport system permease protein
LGALVAAGFGVLLGVITLRLRGDYLAIVTLGFIQIVHLVLVNWDSVTNGPNGILNIGRPQIGPFTLAGPAQFYYVTLAVALLAIVVNTRLGASRVGRALLAIRDDELAAESMGVPTTRLKVMAFALGASWAGVAGVCFAARYAFVSPESFTFFESVVILAMWFWAACPASRAWRSRRWRSWCCPNCSGAWTTFAWRRSARPWWR